MKATKHKLLVVHGYLESRQQPVDFDRRQSIALLSAFWLLSALFD
jgi:hypothetical protein